MDENIIKKIGSVALIILAVFLLFSTFLKSDNIAIIGKWELSPTEKYGYDVYEFHKDSTGIKYRVSNNGDAYDSETFNYKLHDSKITIDMFGVSRVYSYEISGKNLLIDSTLYGKSSGLNGIPWIRYVLVVACLMGSFVIHKSKKTNMDARPVSYSTPDTRKDSPKSAIEHEEETVTKVVVTPTSSLSPAEMAISAGDGRVKTTFKSVSDESVSKEDKGDWFKSAGDL